MEFIIQKCDQGWFVIDFVISVLCIKMPQVNLIKIIPNDDQQTDADDIKYPELEVIIC